MSPQPPAGNPTPTVYEKHQYLHERHMRVLELREVLLSQVTDDSTAHSWVMILGSSMVRPPLACICGASNRPQRDLRAQSDALGLTIDGDRELIGLFNLARARILRYATSDWPDLVPGLVDDVEGLVRRLPKGVTLAKQYPKYFADATQAPAAVPPLPVPSPDTASQTCVPSPSAIPSPVVAPSPAISSGSGAAVLVPPAPGAEHTPPARPLRRASASRRVPEGHYSSVTSRRKDKRFNKPAGWKRVRSPPLYCF